MLHGYVVNYLVLSFFRLRLRRGERSTNYVYVSQGDWSLLSFDEKNRKTKKDKKNRNGNGSRRNTNYVYVLQEDWSLLSFDEKNRKNNKIETEEIPITFMFS